MTMKKYELEKRKAEKLHNDLYGASTPDRFAAGAVLDKKEQRKLDQAKGLVPFACKLNQDLIKDLHAACVARNLTINELMDEVVRKGLAG